MAQGDYLIQNQSFPSFRSDLNSTLEAINTSNSGTSRPSSAVAGTVWLDTTNATNPTLKFFDGTDDISLAQLDYSANTVNWLDSSVVADLVNDTTPQLGGDLDVNGNSIVSVSNGNITFTPDGTGKVIIDGLSFPTADGTTGQFLKTDGSGNLSFDDAGGGTNTPAFFARNTSNQTFSSGATTQISFPNEVFDTDSAFASNGFTVPAGQGGKYFFYFTFVYSNPNASGLRIVYVVKNGGNVVELQTQGDDTAVQLINGSALLDLSAGDFIDLDVYQNSGSSLNSVAIGGNAVQFGGYKIIE